MPVTPADIQTRAELCLLRLCLQSACYSTRKHAPVTRAGDAVMLQSKCASHKADSALTWVQEGNEIYMSEEVAQMIAMQEEDDDDDEDDPDYEPLSMEDDSIQPCEMVSTPPRSS